MGYTRYEPKSYEELPKTNGFLCYFKSYNIFNFHSGVNNAKLFYTPTNIIPPKVTTKLEIDQQKFLSI